ncbi:MAG: hypothetical protein K6W08_09795 [Firmicutes bacterium]|nr:hypothetical protein [Bacillota bacterium]
MSGVGALDLLFFLAAAALAWYLLAPLRRRGAHAVVAGAEAQTCARAELEGDQATDTPSDADSRARRAEVEGDAALRQRDGAWPREEAVP